LLQSTLPIIIEMDCSKLVDEVKASTQDRSSLMYLISDIKSLSSQGRACKFVKVERSQIRVSHSLANLARTNRCTLTWLGSGLMTLFSSFSLITLEPILSNKVASYPQKKSPHEKIASCQCPPFLRAPHHSSQRHPRVRKEGPPQPATTQALPPY
jgi:hypothetical protein